MRAPFRLAARFAFRALLVLGWAVLVLALALLAFEKSGLLVDTARAMLARRLGALGDQLTIGSARLSWFDPGLDLVDVRIGRDGEWLAIDRARATFALGSSLTPRASKIELRGGHVRLSRTLADALQGEATAIGDSSRRVPWTAALPTLRVEDVGLEIESANFGVLPIGRVDALLRLDPRGRPELWGRMVPSLAASAADSGVIFLHGKMHDDTVFEVRASASHLPIGTDYLPTGSDIEPIREWEPHGVLELQSAALLSLDRNVPPRVRARVRVHEGSLRLAPGGRRIEALSLDAGATWTPASWREAFDPRAWRGQALLDSTLEGSRLEATAILGPDAGAGLLAKAWIHAPDLRLDETITKAFGDRPEVARTWAVFEPRGRCSAWIGARLSDDFRADEAWTKRLSVLGAAHFDGRGGMTYHGFAHKDGVRDMGFPLPLGNVSGDVVVSHSLERQRPLTIALSGLSGDSGSSVVTANGLVQSHRADAPLDAPSRGYVEFDLALATRGLANDERLERALVGLSGSLPPDATWRPFHPVGGQVDVDLRLAREVNLPWSAVDLTLDLHDVTLAWDELPIPIVPAAARLRFRSDGKHERALGFALDGTLRTAKRVRFAGRLQTDTAAPQGSPGGHLDECAVFDVAVERFSLTGDDAKILVGRHPRIGIELDELAPKGFADVRYVRVRPARGADTQTSVEVTPRDPAQLKPKQFEMITSGVRGRVLVGTVLDRTGAEETRTRLMPLSGTWGPNVPVAFTARFPEREVMLFGAGIDPSSKSLLGSLRQAMSSPGSGPVDTAAATLEGAIDFVGAIHLGAGPDGKTASEYRFFLHDSALTTADGFALDRLRGELTVANDTLVGDRLAARLANTPVVLRDTRVASDKRGFTLSTHFDAEGVPIDKGHLGAFIDENTLDALLTELGWKGALDVRDGRIMLFVPNEGPGRLEFGGRVIPHGMSIQLGLPITVERATATIEKLVYEGGSVRAIVQIEDFDGLVADRALENASMLVTYIEPKLSVENFNGRFEGGELVPLGGDASRRGTMFSIGIEPPFGFSLAFGLRRVDAAGLLRGLFPSDMATRGHLDLELRLQGDMDHLLGIVGSGSIKVLESRLWSIPVFRALFGQLGLDDTAVFDSMAANLLVKEGRVEMNDITVRSPLLQLVGSGALDFDGGLKYDLEVRYDLIDRLGPFTRLLYFVQNKLLSVAIRGDMARPEVILENPFTYLFRRRDREGRPLPLPPFASLPARF